MEKINLSEPAGTRERWLAGALRESTRIGRAVSLSEYIRRTEEAYAMRVEFVEPKDANADHVESLCREMAASMRQAQTEGHRVDATGPAKEAEAIAFTSDLAAARRPYTKERQTGAKKV